MYFREDISFGQYFLDDMQIKRLFEDYRVA
jgi:hypothetical protein